MICVMWENQLRYMSSLIMSNQIPNAKQYLLPGNQFWWWAHYHNRYSHCWWNWSNEMLARTELPNPSMSRPVIHHTYMSIYQDTTSFFLLHAEGFLASSRPCSYWYNEQDTNSVHSMCILGHRKEWMNDTDKFFWRNT